MTSANCSGGVGSITIQYYHCVIHGILCHPVTLAGNMPKSPNLSPDHLPADTQRVLFSTARSPVSRHFLAVVKSG